ncbi:16984_t:CDS:2 [Funneliformis caledonium]|uniref:16984_t:CDS:1 n=1 Tax=Funneliformis caledonium TaxID=1117310 RepID=A0A9N8WQV9_9GLOM|nr:16984_t:CDS:2 [Funneliformis caledonium]
MDEATKRKYCHLLMFDVSEQSQETALKNNVTDQGDNVKPCLNNSSRQTATTIAPSSLANKSIKQRKPRARKPKRTPRPPNAFILYRKAKQPDVIAHSKNLTNAEVSKVISKMWWRETEEERFQWEKRADRMKLKHMQDYPDYVYQPKKPGTKKRKSQRDKSMSDVTSASTFSVIPSSEKNSTTLPDETIAAIAEVAFIAGSNRSMSPTSDNHSLPSPPSSTDSPIYETSYDSHPNLSENFDSFLDAQPVDKFSYFIGQDAYAASSSQFSYPFNCYDVTSADNYANLSNSTGETSVLLNEFLNNGATISPPAPTMIEDMPNLF